MSDYNNKWRVGEGPEQTPYMYDPKYSGTATVDWSKVQTGIVGGQGFVAGGAGPVRDYPLKGYIDDLLAARDSSHGDYNETARLIQQLKAVMHQEKGWQDLNAPQKEALDMVATKIGRILCGDQNFKDSWDDIAGYATLIANRCK